jgi:NMD protein affecting ribosome stability and mRNA decay
MHKDYFEAILQIRPRDDKVLEYVKREASKVNTGISKIIDKKFGYDVYLTSRKTVVQIGKSLKKKFGGETKFSKTLHSTDRLTSKLRYRVTVLFRVKQKELLNEENSL